MSTDAKKRGSWNSRPSGTKITQIFQAYDNAATYLMWKIITQPFAQLLDSVSKWPFFISIRLNVAVQWREELVGRTTVLEVLIQHTWQFLANATSKVPTSLWKPLRLNPLGFDNSALNGFSMFGTDHWPQNLGCGGGAQKSPQTLKTALSLHWAVYHQIWWCIIKWMFVLDSPLHFYSAAHAAWTFGQIFVCFMHLIPIPW